MLDVTYIEEPTPGEANLTLITKPADQALLTQTSTEDGIRLAHPLQVAWDVHHLGGTDRAEASVRLLDLGSSSIIQNQTGSGLTDKKGTRSDAEKPVDRSRELLR